MASSRPAAVLTAVRAVVRSRLLAPLRPDKYVRMAAVVRGGVDATMGIRLAAIRRPEAPGVIDDRGTITWRQLDESGDALANGLERLGSGPPASVGVLCRNHRGFVQAITAAGRVGADTVLLNTSFAGPQLAEVVAREGVEVLIHDQEFDGIAAGLDALERPPRRVHAWTDRPSDLPTIDSLVATSPAGKRRPVPPGRIVLLTSGTTGTPKGARRPSGGSASSLVAILTAIPWRAEERIVVAAPMFHAWGFAQTLIAATMTCTIVTARRFDAEHTLRLVERHRADGLIVVPVMLERIVDLPDPALARHRSSLRFVSASGSRMRPDAVTRFMDRFGDVVYNNYNATEAGMISIATPDDLRRAPDTAGRPVFGTEVRVVDDAGLPVALGEVGRIFVHNDSMFEGYTSGDSKTFLDGFISSGDIGRTDQDGRLYVVGRDDDMIVSGGENVLPIEVETTLAGHAAVREVAVFGVDDAEFGERLVAFVVPQPDTSPDPEALRTHVRDQLASFKVPRSITLVDELPRNAVGKIDKRQLLDRLEGTSR